MGLNALVKGAGAGGGGIIDIVVGFTANDVEPRREFRPWTELCVACCGCWWTDVPSMVGKVSNN